MMGNRAARMFAGALVCAVAVLGWGWESAASTTYDIRVSLDTETDTLVGTQTVNYVNASDAAVEEITFALIANWGAEENPYLHPALLDPDYTSGFDPTWTHVDRVTDTDGNALPYRLEESVPALQTYSLQDVLLIIELPRPLEPGDATTFEMQFETHFARALLADNCVYRDTYVWRFGWHPFVIDDMSAALGAFELPGAEFRVMLTVPSAYRAYGGADQQRSMGESAGLTTVELNNDRLARSIPLLIGRDLQSVTSTWGEVALEAVFLPGNETYARAALSYAADILAAHSQVSGDLSASRIVIAQNPTPGFFGLAADGMILVGSGLIELRDMPARAVYDRLNEYLLAHELAHLWWGIGIGADFNAENWVSEGFAEYLALTYFERTHGAMEPNLFAQLQPGLIEDLLADAYGGLNLRRHMEELPYLRLLQLGFDEPIVQPIAASEYLNGLTIRTYSKGYLVLRSLESILGTEDMHRLLVEAHDAWDGRMASVDALQELAERISGRDLDAFFRDWVYGATEADAAIDGVTLEETDVAYVAQVDIVRPGPAFSIVVEARLDDGRSIRKTVDAGDGPTVVRFESDAPFSTFSVDPDEMLVDSNRYNNHWPRKLLLSHPFRRDEELAVGLPLDAYVIDVSAFGISGGFRNDHAWSVMWLPHIDASTNMFGDVAKVDAVATFVGILDRATSVSFTGSLTAWQPATWEGDLDARLSLDLLTFTHPETGTPGQYWYPTWQQTLTMGAAGPVASPVPYVSWTILWDGLPSTILTHALTVQLGVPGIGSDPFATVEWQTSHRLRLAHLFYLDLGVTISETLFPDLPNPFLFDLDALHAFEYLPAGHHQVFASLELVLPPIVRDAGYALFNLTRLNSVTPSLFLQGGRTKANCVTACEPGLRWEAGVKLAVSFPVFFGESVTLAIGYAHPLVGVDGAGTIFLEIQGLAQ